MKGNVDGIPDLVIDTVTDLVKGNDDGTPERDGLSDLVLERVTVWLVVGV